MKATKFVALAERDAEIIVVLMRLLEVMRVTHSARITMAGVIGVLNYKQEILAIREALALLGADPDEPVSIAAAREKL